MARGSCRFVSYRDVFYIFCICALSLVSLHSKIECPTEIKGYFGRPVIHRQESEHLENHEAETLVKNNIALKGQVEALKMRVDALERENKWLNIEKETKVQTEIELVKLRSRLGKASQDKLAALEEERATEILRLSKEMEERLRDAEPADEETEEAVETSKHLVVNKPKTTSSPQQQQQQQQVSEEEDEEREEQEVEQAPEESEDVEVEVEEQQEEVSHEQQSSDDEDTKEFVAVVAAAAEEEEQQQGQENTLQEDEEQEDDEASELQEEQATDAQEVAESSSSISDEPEEEEESMNGNEEEEEEEEEEDEDEEDEPVPASPKALGYKDLGNKKFKLLNQVSPNTKKHFKAVGTKFISLFRAWEHAGWKHRYDSTSLVSLYLTKPITKVPGSAGKMLSQISKSSCIGGSKGAQLRCKVNMAEKHGCNYTDLHISPKQFNMLQRSDCEQFIKIAMKPKNANKMWILKDGGAYHGKRMKVYEGLKSEVKKRFGKCSKDKKTGAGYIMMEYIANPLLFEGRKFDLRTYMLIASTKPLMVFYHKGFVRRSGTAYKNSTFSRLGHITNHKSQDKVTGHFWGFDQLGEYLHKEESFPEDYMDTTFRNYVKHATNFIFQAARHKLKRRSGSFMLFGLDWMIDRNKQIHFLEANGNPTIQNYEGTGLGPTIWNDMAELLTKLHREPDALKGEPTVASGFHLGGWELVFNEAEEIVNGQTYNACKLPDYLKCKNPKVCEIW